MVFCLLILNPNSTGDERPWSAPPSTAALWQQRGLTPASVSSEIPEILKCPSRQAPTEQNQDSFGDVKVPATVDWLLPPPGMDTTLSFAEGGRCDDQGTQPRHCGPLFFLLPLAWATTQMLATGQRR